jgi:CRP/FNR family cyclic AMP-dependent transcriptional regulator
MNDIHLLRLVPLFAGVPDQDLSPLADCLIRRTFAKDVVIFSAGGPGNCLYIIETGRVRVFLTSSNGQEICLNTYGPGQVFGEISILDGMARSASVAALEQTVALVLEREDFLHYLDTHPAVARNGMTMLAARLRHTTTFAESLVFLDVPGRVAAKLLQLVAGYNDAGSASIELSMTQGELATWVAASRESVNKALSDFRDQELIRVSGQRITILNRRGLQKKIVF